MNELLLAPFCPFDIKYRKLNAKNLRKYIFKGWDLSKFFIYFQACTRLWGPLYLLEIL